MHWVRSWAFHGIQTAMWHDCKPARPCPMPLYRQTFTIAVARLDVRSMVCRCLEVYRDCLSPLQLWDKCMTSAHSFNLQVKKKQFYVCSDMRSFFCSSLGPELQEEPNEDRSRWKTDGKGDRICAFPLKATPAGRLVVELLEVRRGKIHSQMVTKFHFLYNITSEKGKGPRGLGPNRD